MKRFVLLMSMFAGVAGCATPPDKIVGVPNAGPCTQADRERLAIVSNQQNKAATGDALGVFLIGVPVPLCQEATTKPRSQFSKGAVARQKPSPPCRATAPAARQPAFRH